MAELIDVGSLFIQGINLAIIVYVLNRFIFVPYLSYIDTEMAQRKQLEEQMARADELFKKAESEAKNLVEKAKNQAKVVREEARSLAKQEASLLIFEANKEIEALKAKADSDIASERATLLQEMKTKILDVALKLNARLFSDAKAHQSLLEKFAKDL